MFLLPTIQTVIGSWSIRPANPGNHRQPGTADGMRTSNWLAPIFLSFLLAIASCKKADQPVGTNQEFYGVELDWPRLKTDFTNASPEIQASAEAAAHSFRCADFPRAMAALDKL